MLSEVSQVQKDKGLFSLIYGRHLQKINVHTKTNMIIYTFICRTYLLTVALGGRRGKE
jgi:hypothetical protein